MDDQEAGLVELLRRLAGRLPDDQLAGLRTDLAEGQLDELEWTVLYRLRAHEVRLTPAEVALLPLGELEPDDFATEPPGARRPAYRFEPADPAPADEPLLTLAETRTTPRRIRKARRLPANDLATLPAKDIYVVEFAPGADVVRRQAGLSPAAGGALLEAVAEDEPLPPYQADALAAGRTIWPR